MKRFKARNPMRFSTAIVSVVFYWFRGDGADPLWIPVLKTGATQSAVTVLSPYVYDNKFQSSTPIAINSLRLLKKLEKTKWNHEQVGSSSCVAFQIGCKKLKQATNYMPHWEQIGHNLKITFSWGENAEIISLLIYACFNVLYISKTLTHWPFTPFFKRYAANRNSFESNTRAMIRRIWTVFDKSKMYF